MKAKKFLPLLGLMSIALVACNGATGPAMTGKCEIGGLPCTVDLVLQEGNKALFDFTVQGELPQGMPDLSTMLDKTLDYTVSGNIYTFTGKAFDNKAQAEIDVKYVTDYDEASKTHSFTYKIYSDLGVKEVPMTGKLPL